MNTMLLIQILNQDYYNDVVKEYIFLFYFDSFVFNIFCVIKNNDVEINPAPKQQKNNTCM